MTRETDYDVVIIGGGLAGLSLSIQLAKQGYEVVVIEKDDYPRHKVCGEYVSMESKPFLEQIGLPISAMALPLINTLNISDTKGKMLSAVLPQGGFGISRYKLDAELAAIARSTGVVLLTNTKAEDVVFENDTFSIKAGEKILRTKVVCGTWGKRSNMDVKLQRSFIGEQKQHLNNYVGVKYHIRYPWPEHLIALHNFREGYCGISRIEDDKCCLCYLTSASNLQRNGNDIKKMEIAVLSQNPELKKIFTGATFLYKQPLTISQISFEKKEQVQDHVLLLGDAAGMISPLCGNGMSMAFHSAVIAFALIQDFLGGRMSRKKMEEAYTRKWNKQFSRRLGMGRYLQGHFGNEKATTAFLGVMKAFPFLQKPIIKATAGKPF